MTKKCEIHGVDLERDSVAILYGLPAYPPAGYYGSRDKDFPNAKTSVLGGCSIDPDQPETQSVNFCRQCRIAEMEWLKAHDSPEI